MQLHKEQKGIALPNSRAQREALRQAREQRTTETLSDTSLFEVEPETVEFRENLDEYPHEPAHVRDYRRSIALLSIDELRMNAEAAGLDDVEGYSHEELVVYLVGFYRVSYRRRQQRRRE